MLTTDLVLGDVTNEWANTRRVLEAIPDDELTWKPHEKSMTLGELATHIVNIGVWSLAVLRAGEFDLATVPARREALTSRAAVLDEFDTHVRELEAALADLDDDALVQEWTLRHGDHVIIQQPRALALRYLGVNHMIHHRAQLGVYLRMLDVPVPGVYGPSADDMAG